MGPLLYSRVGEKTQGFDNMRPSMLGRQRRGQRPDFRQKGGRHQSFFLEKNICVWKITFIGTDARSVPMKVGNNFNNCTEPQIQKLQHTDLYAGYANLWFWFYDGKC